MAKKQPPLTAELSVEVRPEVPPRPDLWFVIAYSLTAKIWRLIPGDQAYVKREPAEYTARGLGLNWRGARVVRIPGDPMGG